MATYVAVFALILAYVALVAAFLALRTLARVRRSAAALARAEQVAEPGQTEAVTELQRTQGLLADTAQDATQRVQRLTEEVSQLRTQLAEQIQKRREPRTPPPSGLRNVALVRYDAFGEMSGRLSFSLALLDDTGDGVTVSAIAGATDTRVYAKPVADGKGEQDLSPEERQAVSAALGKRRAAKARKSA